jgi:hypothetical protein
MSCIRRVAVKKKRVFLYTGEKWLVEDFTLVERCSMGV